MHNDPKKRKLPKKFRNEMEKYIYSINSVGACCGANKYTMCQVTRADIEKKFLDPEHRRIVLAYGRVGKAQDKDGIQIKHVNTQNGPVTVRIKYEW